MKFSGLIRRIDNLGRIVVPKEIRIDLGLKEGAPVFIDREDDHVIIRKYEDKKCTKCGTPIYESFKYCPNCGRGQQGESYDS